MSPMEIRVFFLSYLLFTSLPNFWNFFLQVCAHKRLPYKYCDRIEKNRTWKKENRKWRMFGRGTREGE